ncbi:unnamed protein product [Lampetra fluviatilis]
MLLGYRHGALRAARGGGARRGGLSAATCPGRTIRPADSAPFVVVFSVELARREQNLNPSRRDGNSGLEVELGTDSPRAESVAGLASRGVASSAGSFTERARDFQLK